MLTLKNVQAAYGTVKALNGVTLEVPAGHIVCLIGANGAGKSTTLMAVSGLVRVTTGQILWENREIQNTPPHRIVADGISQVPEGRRIFASMTVEENLQMGAYRNPDAAGVRNDLERSFALFPILGDRRRQIAGTLSGGEQQMLAIARALMSRPRLLLLDEPSLGLGPKIVQTIFEKIQAINRGGVTLLLVEQNARLALTLSHEGYVMEQGRIVLAGKSDYLLHHDQVRKAYLGK